MKKEIDAIRVKDISQGGLTQGQQTQIARNEQRTSQIMEELDSLEETLNESIQESLGARSGKVVHGRKKGYIEEEEDVLSDDDDFYDRTKKKNSAKISGEQPAVETANTLLDKKDHILKEMEEKKTLLLQEKDKLGPTAESSSEGGDDLDAYMTGLSSQLVIDKTVKIQKELSELQTELDRVTYLLKIADPMGDASRKREMKIQAPKLSQPTLDMRKQPQPKQKKLAKVEKSMTSSPLKQTSSPAQEEEDPKEVEDGCESKESKPPAYTATKPQWLGATKDMKLEDDRAQDVHVDVTESDNFVDYKDRKKVLTSVESEQELEQAAPGLIIRKRKSEDKPGETVDKAQKVEEASFKAETTAADAVALLLKHKRGYVAFDEEMRDESQEGPHTRSTSAKDKSQPKRVIGPSRPDFLAKSPDYEAWMPPEGQTGYSEELFFDEQPFRSTSTEEMILKDLESNN
ncbi:kanadaptin [Iris pallida]|uniref:Kanadaptin n=1 Tax=Iris pallida TaxID=29817 RepID=A0AAX6FNS9_IRIPA|nr:kanadaptin [Iris pallida]KAJ6817675.1 kanadaptin [Iris pallida]